MWCYHIMWNSHISHRVTSGDCFTQNISWLRRLFQWRTEFTSAFYVSPQDFWNNVKGDYSNGLSMFISWPNPFERRESNRSFSFYSMIILFKEITPMVWYILSIYLFLVQRCESKKQLISFRFFRYVFMLFLRIPIRSVIIGDFMQWIICFYIERIFETAAVRLWQFRKSVQLLCGYTQAGDVRWSW